MELTESLLASLSSAYVGTGLLVAAAYLPRLRRMMRNLDATAASYSPGSEVTWTGCRFVSLLYVALVAQSTLITVVVALDLAGRFASLAIVLHARRQQQRSVAQDDRRGLHAARA